MRGTGDIEDDGCHAEKTKHHSRSVNFEEFILASGKIPLGESGIVPYLTTRNLSLIYYL